MSPSISRLLASVAVLALAACSTPIRPDLARLYRVGTGPADTTPVIVIPGLFGSKLRSRTTGAEVWPGKWTDVLWGDYRGLALDFDPVTLSVRGDDLEAYDLADSVLGHDIYRPIIDALQRFGGYVRGTPGTRVQAGERRYYVFPYDWRQDNVVHARELEQLIDTIRLDYGDPELVRLYSGDIVKPVPGVPYDELMLEPGDGRVTKPSLLARETLDPMAPQSEDSFLPVAYWFFLCEQHDQLTTTTSRTTS